VPYCARYRFSALVDLYPMLMRGKQILSVEGVTCWRGRDADLRPFFRVDAPLPGKGAALMSRLSGDDELNGMGTLSTRTRYGASNFRALDSPRFTSGEKITEKKGVVLVRSATASGRSTAVYTLTGDGSLLLCRTEPRGLAVRRARRFVQTWAGKEAA
jgi:hypothetical protein